MQEQQDKRSINSLIEQKFVPPVPSAAQTNFLGLNVFFFFFSQSRVRNYLRYFMLCVTCRPNM